MRAKIRIKKLTNPYFQIDSNASYNLLTPMTQARNAKYLANINTNGNTDVKMIDRP